MRGWELSHSAYVVVASPSVNLLLGPQLTSKKVSWSPPLHKCKGVGLGF